MKTIEELLRIDKVDLSPGEFYAVWKHEQKINGSSGIRKNMVPADQLYELYEYYSNEKGKPLTGNMFVKVIRAEGEKCSNERAKVLVEAFRPKYEEEKENGEG